MPSDDCLKKLYIEPTARCNLRCKMCFRNSWKNEIIGDMRPETFRKAMTTMPDSVETVFFGGMGEPLAHPDIVEMVRTASSLGAAPGEVSALGGDALRLCERSLPGAPFGVVFLDPPYALDAGEVSRLVGLLASSGQLERGAIVVYERSSKAEGLDCPGLALAKTKTRGITAVDLHVYEEDPK